MPAWRIVFFGTPDFAVASLNALIKTNDPVVGVVCQPDRPAGRGQKLSQPPVKQTAVAVGISVLQPTKVRTAEFLAALTQWQPDLIVVAAYGRILPDPILVLPAQGCINVHASLLPKYRGAAPIQWSLLNGDAQSGVTIMRMSTKMDAGDILLQRETAIGDNETYAELQTRLADLGALALVDAIAQLHTGTLIGKKQDDTQVTMAPMIGKEDGRIEWQLSSEILARRVRAFNPWPSATTLLNGKLLKVHRARSTSEPSGTPGVIASVIDGIVVGTGNGALVIDELQLEGRKRLSAVEFARGGALDVGTRLG